MKVPVAKYKCDACGRETEFMMMTGSPLRKLPNCRGGCPGSLILQEAVK